MRTFFRVCFRTSRAIPGKIPGQACGGDPSPLRKGLQSFPESTPVLPEKNWSTPRRGLETDQEYGLDYLSSTSSLREDIFFRQRRYTSPAIEDIPHSPFVPPLQGSRK